jgi:hypothetical protein
MSPYNESYKERNENEMMRILPTDQSKEKFS